MDTSILDINYYGYIDRLLKEHQPQLSKPPVKRFIAKRKTREQKAQRRHKAKKAVQL